MNKTEPIKISKRYQAKLHQATKNRPRTGILRNERYTIGTSPGLDEIGGRK
jgi:hypothetical protein